MSCLSKLQIYCLPTGQLQLEIYTIALPHQVTFWTVPTPLEFKCTTELKHVFHLLHKGLHGGVALTLVRGPHTL